MTHSIEMGWFVLDKYYGLSDATPAYAAAILLHPSKRARYIRKGWVKSWQQPAIDAVRELWLSEYEGRSVNLPISAVRPAVSTREPTALDRLRAKLNDVEDEDGDNDEFNDFINDRRIQLEGYTTGLEWWCDPAQIRRYPRLSRMALDLLSIPPMSGEIERVFSGARRTISWDRSRLLASTIEAVECVGNWLRGGLIRSMGRSASMDGESSQSTVLSTVFDSVENADMVHLDMGVLDLDIDPEDVYEEA